MLPGPKLSGPGNSIIKTRRRRTVDRRGAADRPLRHLSQAPLALLSQILGFFHSLVLILLFYILLYQTLRWTRAALV